MKRLTYILLAAFLSCIVCESTSASSYTGDKNKKTMSYTKAKRQLKKMNKMRVKEQKHAGKYHQDTN